MKVVIGRYGRVRLPVFVGTCTAGECTEKGG